MLGFAVSLPEKCSFVSDSNRCGLPPEFVLSVRSSNGQFMVAVACNDHRDAILGKILSLQKKGEVPEGILTFEPLGPMQTDCIIGLEEDYADIEADRIALGEKKNSGQ